MNIIVNPAAAPPPPMTDSEELYEIIDGLRVELPPMSTAAGMLATLLSGLMFPQVRNQGHLAMEVLFHLPLPRDRNRRPDLAFVSFERWARERPFGDKNAWKVVPNLAIEVVSPSDYAEDLMDKIEEYFAAGVQIVWIIYPKHALVQVYESLTRVHGLGRADVLEAGTVLPGFRLALSELFPAAITS